LTVCGLARHGLDVGDATGDRGGEVGEGGFGVCSVRVTGGAGIGPKEDRGVVEPLRYEALAEDSVAAGIGIVVAGRVDGGDQPG
jgi:hypothetical protein